MTLSAHHSNWDYELLVFSANSRAALINQLAQLEPSQGAKTLLQLARDFAQKPALELRLAIIAESTADLISKVDRALKYLNDPARQHFNLGNRVFFGRAQDYAYLRQTALLFPGFGAHHPSMVADLYANFGTIRRWFENLDGNAQARFQQNNLLFETVGTGDDGYSTAKSMAEPGFANTMDAVLAGNLALHTILADLIGLSTEAMVGHSYGENAMMIASGMVEDYQFVVDLVRYISEGMRDTYRQRRGKPEPVAMLAVTAAARDALKHLWENEPSSINLALDNCPQQAILCGPVEEVEKIELLIKEQGHIAFRIPILDQPIHTPLFPIAESDLQRLYDGIAIRPSGVNIYSCATSAPFPKDPSQIRRLLAEQWSTPVRFRETIERLYADGIRTFIEVGPGGRLSGFVRDTLRGKDAVAIPANMEKRGTILQLQICVAQLFTRGHELNLTRFFNESLAVDERSEMSGLEPYRQAADGGSHLELDETWKTKSSPSIIPAITEPTASSNQFAAELLAVDPRQRLRLIEAHVLDLLTEIMELTGTDWIDPQQGFFDLGLGSLGAVELAMRLQESLALDLPETIAFDYPTTNRLADFLNTRMQNEDQQSNEKIISTNQQDPTANKPLSPSSDIAIIGMGCRFPGNANSPDEFWELLINGRDAITEVPDGRWPQELYSDYQEETQVRMGGFLDDIATFDNAFFAISPREAQSLDPQQRLLLEVTWEAIEQAGLNHQELSKGKTGVFIGISHTDYAQRLTAQERLAVKGYMGTGNAHSTAAGRLSFVLGLTGPCLALDTACSSSLVTVHLACQSLNLEESEIAIAGGVNLLLSPETSIYLSQAHALSADGRCQTFDASANGYVRSEGCGIIILKRLPDAIADGDNVLAVIRGSAINHDGRTSGLTVPNGPAQQAVIRQALTAAGITPDQVDIIESHGTGTSLGDPIEVQALGQVFSEGQERQAPLILGAVKTNIGHLEAAAGIAGLMKIVLQLQHQQTAPNLHFQTPNPKINWRALPVRVSSQPGPWIRSEKPRIAGVSSFGMSGTNAHIILQEAPYTGSREGLDEKSDANLPYLLTLSAKSQPALSALAAEFAQFISHNHNVNLTDLCYTSHISRSDFNQRLALVANSREELQQALVEAGEASDYLGRKRVNYKRPKVAFLFSGQGAQYSNMGRQLFETEPVFRQALEKCDTLLQSHLALSIISLMFANDAVGDSGGSASSNGQRIKTLLDQTTYTQPALFAIEYALAALWRSWGIEPDVVMGHSIGEYTAAHIAGIFSLEDAVRLVAARGKLMGSLPHGGAMLAVRGSEKQVAAVLEKLQIDLAVAAVNGPQSVVLSGSETAIDQVEEALTAREIHHTHLIVSHAFHSPLMDPVLDAFRAVAANVSYQQPQLPVISNLTGKRAGAEMLSPDYWTQHLRRPVQFAKGMTALDEENCTIFLEVGPKPVLVTMGQACVPPRDQLWLPSVQPPQADRQRMITSLGQLYSKGLNVNWSGFHKDHRHQKLPLPTYPFQRERYWIAPNADQAAYYATSGNQQSLLGDPLLLPGSAGQFRFEARVSAAVSQLLHDYHILGQHVLPLSAYLTTAFRAAQEVIPLKSLEISQFNVPQALMMPDEGPLLLHTALTAEQDGHYHCQIFSRPFTKKEAPWTLHAAMLLRTRSDAETVEMPKTEPIRLPESNLLEPDNFYRSSKAMGFDYGEAFRTVGSLQLGPDNAAAAVILPDILKPNNHQALQQPALLDGAFQALGALLFQRPDRGFYIVKHIEQVIFYRDLPPTVEVMVSLEWPEDEENPPLATVTILTPERDVIIARIRGIGFSKVQIESPITNNNRRSAALEKVLNAPDDEKYGILARRLQKLMARLLGLPRQEALDMSQPFSQIGLDSLLAMQMRNRVQVDFDVDVPVTRFIEGLSINTMTPLVLEGIAAAKESSESDSALSALGEEIEWIEGEL